jgi:TetR/AcrR family transcriptional repressor of bet genes
VEQGAGLNPVAKTPRTKRRTASKESRQVQLIKATIRSIAKHGLSVTTMATVSREAGLSQGIINLHFQSKKRLLEETLRYIVDEYRVAWDKALDRAGDSAVQKLTALVSVDFDKRICQRNKLAVWFAFWGESKSRLTYRKIYSERAREYKQVLTGLCEEIITQGHYKVRAQDTAVGLVALHAGLWLDLLLSPSDMGPEQAHQVSLAYLHSVFPDHFTI